MSNVGKVFEKNFKESVELLHPHCTITRLYDGTGGYLIKNICDFILYKYPYQCFIELKAYKGNTINFSVISDTQYNGLLKMSEVNGIVSGVLFRYNDFNDAYFIDIRVIQSLKQDGHKSIPYNLAKVHGVQLPIIKQYKVKTIYDIKTFLDNVYNKKLLQG